MKNICIVSSTRADFGIFLPLIKRLLSCSDVSVRLVVTGTHLEKAFGETLDEIVQDGIAIDKIIDINMAGNSPKDMSVAMANTITGFADYFAERRPDILVVLGDRYEIAAVCCAALNERIPIAHLHGGELTEGLIDDSYRHSITKMSYLHFTSCEVYRRRVIQLGEAPERVFNVGALGVENTLHTPLLSLAELQENLGFDLKKRPYAVVTFHPVTLENNTAEQQMAELIAAMDAFPHMGYIITKANADAGGAAINAIWDTAAKNHPNWFVTPSLGMQRYLSALKYAQMMLGNSSSGIIEAPAMHIPTVNIGDRQKGRLMADSILCCAPERAAICAAMERALSPEVKALAQRSFGLFGDGTSSEKILAALLYYLNGDHSSTKKKFYDVEYTQ